MHGNQATVDAFFPCSDNGLLCLKTDRSAENYGAIISFFYGDGFSQLEIKGFGITVMDILLIFITTPVEYRAFVFKHSTSCGFCFDIITGNDDYHIGKRT